MKKLLIASLALFAGLMACAQNIVVSVAAKSPAVLYKNFSEIVNQLPPNAVQAKMMAAMGFASIGAPNFDGVDPNANMGFCIFDDESTLFVLNASDNAMLCQMAADPSKVKRSGNWVVFSDNAASENFDEKAKLAIETVQKAIDADVVAKIYPDKFDKMLPQDAPENLRALLKDEIELIFYKFNLNTSKVEMNFQVSAKSGSLSEKVLKSLRKADEIPEAKFVSKDHYVTILSSLISTKETLAAMSELFEKYFKLEKSQLEILQKLPSDTGTDAGYIDINIDMNMGDGASFASFSKSPMTIDEYLDYVNLVSYLASDIIKAIVPEGVEISPTPMQISDKSECEIDSVKVASFKQQQTKAYIASVNGIFIATSSNSISEAGDEGDNGKQLIREAIKIVKGEKTVENPLPSKIDDDFLVTLNLSKVNIEYPKELEEIFADFAPIVFKGNFDGANFSLKAEIPTSSIVNAAAKGFEIQAREMQEQMQVKQVPVQQGEGEEAEAPQQK